MALTVPTTTTMIASSGKGALRRGREPLEQSPRQAEERRVQHDSGQDGARSAAARAVSAGKPFVERQQTKLGAEADQQEEADADLRRELRAAARADEAGEVQRRRPEAEDRDGEDERDGADFEQREHEQDRSSRATDSSRSDRIMTAPPRLIGSHATSSAAPF